MYKWSAQVLNTTSLAYSGFKFRNLIVRESIGFGNDGNKVNFGVKPTHELNIKRFQPEQRLSDQKE